MDDRPISQPPLTEAQDALRLKVTCVTFFASPIAGCALTVAAFRTFARITFVFSIALCSSPNLPGSLGASTVLDAVLNLGWDRPTLRVFIPYTFVPATAAGVLNAPCANGTGVTKDGAGAFLVDAGVEVVWIWQAL